jgi:hypothetical protein
MTATKVAGVAFASLVGLALASTSASAQGYGPGYGPGPGPEGGWWAWHNGLTVEASLGLGYLNQRANGTSASDFAFGLNVGVGGFVAPNMAISLRLASSTYSYDYIDGSSAEFTSMVIGPHIQYWATPQLWLGAGAGVALANAFFGDGDGNGTVSSNNGLGLDLRAGVTFGQRWRRSYNLSLEITPAFYGDTTITGVQFEFGYQFL